ncbi:MAG TPA: cobalt transporter CbiM [Kiritimatiellia bacterium]|nr:cobalt transporter CbiM [Kiritimatiellia bacterium]
MHLADGILSPPVLVAGTTIAIGSVVLGLRSLDLHHIPRAAVMTAVFFTASFLHVPLGPGQIHFVFSGLAALVLGSAVFPALLIGLFLQAILLGYGGITALGVNLVIMAFPAWLAALPARRRLARASSRSLVIAIGAAVAVASILGSIAIMSLALLLSDPRYRNLLPPVIALHAPLLLMEALATAGATAFLHRVHPELITHSRYPPS